MSNSKAARKNRHLVYFHPSVVTALDALARINKILINGKPNRSGMITELVIREVQRLRAVAEKTAQSS